MYIANKYTFDKNIAFYCKKAKNASQKQIPRHIRSY